MKSITQKALVFLMVFGLLLSGCGGQKQAATQAPATQPPATQQASKTSVAPTAAANPVTLVFWSMYNEGETIQGWQADAINAFEASHPNVKIKVVWAGRKNVSVKLRNAIISNGKLPDIIDSSNTELTIGLLSQNLALPLDDYLKTPAYNSDKVWGDVYSLGHGRPQIQQPFLRDSPHGIQFGLVLQQKDIPGKQHHHSQDMG